MAENEDVQPLVCDNGSGMVKVRMDPNVLWFCSSCMSDFVEIDAL